MSLTLVLIALIWAKMSGNYILDNLPPSSLSTRSLVDVIGADLDELSKAFRRVGVYLIAQPDGFMHKSIQEISRVAAVSEPTVIRFCRHYGFKGMADFRIALAMSLAGQAGAGDQSYLEPRVSDKAGVNLPQKAAIAHAALRLVAQDRSIIVDSGSTTQLFVAGLRDASPLVIMTTGLNIVETLRGSPQHKVMLPGGTVRYESMSLSGGMVETTLANMRFDTLYLGADSIDPEMGLSTFNEVEAHQNAAMIRICNRVVVLADSTKFRAPALHRFCDVAQIHTIITDTGLPDTIAARLEAQGVQVHCADPNVGSH